MLGHRPQPFLGPGSLTAPKFGFEPNIEEERRRRMSMAEMQACLARLYVDGASRRLFALEPETVLGEYRLSAEEARALRDLDRRALERFAISLNSKRRRRFVATYPLLFGLASPAV